MFDAIPSCSSDSFATFLIPSYIIPIGSFPNAAAALNATPVPMKNIPTIAKTILIFLSCFNLIVPFLYDNLSSTEVPIVPSGIDKPKLSTTVAPITANVFSSGSNPFPSIDLEYARKGTFSLV